MISIYINGGGIRMQKKSIGVCNLTEYLTKRAIEREIRCEVTGNDGKPRKIKGFSELMKRGGTRIDTLFEKRAHFLEQKEKLSTLSTKRAGKPHKQRVPGSFLNWNE